MYKKYAEIRSARKMSNLAVAQAANIPPTTIYDWKGRAEKNEDAEISTAALKKIAEVLEVSIEDLI